MGYRLREGTLSRLVWPLQKEALRKFADRCQDLLIVEMNHKFTRCSLNALIACDGLLQGRLVSKNPNLGAEFLLQAVRTNWGLGSVIDDHDLPVGIGLTDNATDCFPQQARPVMRWNDDRDFLIGQDLQVFVGWIMIACRESDYDKISANCSQASINAHSNANLDSLGCEVLMTLAARSPVKPISHIV